MQSIATAQDSDIQQLVVMSVVCCLVVHMYGSAERMWSDIDVLLTHVAQIRLFVFLMRHNVLAVMFVRASPPVCVRVVV